MNKCDIGELRRIYNCLKIPGPGGGGTQSQGIAGLANHSRDASWIIDKVTDVLLTYGQGEDWEGQREEILTEMERWHRARKKVGWRSPGGQIVDLGRGKPATEGGDSDG